MLARTNIRGWPLCTALAALLGVIASPCAAQADARYDDAATIFSDADAACSATGEGPSPALREALAGLLAEAETGAEQSDAPGGDARSLALFCLSAGQAALAHEAGSDAYAVRLLSKAYAAAEASSDEALAAQAAYALAIASIGANPSPDGGGARRGATPPQGQLAEASACRLLGDARSGGVAAPEVALTCAIRRARESGDSLTRAQAHLRLARFRLDSAVGLGPGAARELRGAAAQSALAGIAVGDVRGEDHAAILGRLVETALDADAGVTPAMERAVAAMRSAAPGNTAIQAEASALEARVALAQGQRSAAIADLQQAIFLESQSAAPVRLPSWHLLLAEADPENRAAHVAAAYDALESVRPLMPVRDPLTQESTFSLRVRPVFEAQLEVLLRSGDVSPAEQIRRAQTVLEAYRQAEIESVFGSDCVPPLNPISPQTLEDGEIVLYPVVLRDRVELIYASKATGGVWRRLAPSRIGRAEIESLVAQTLATARTLDVRRNWSSAERLYDVLIAPIKGELGPDSTLIIVPDGPLRMLPFAALRDASTDEYLLQQTRLAITPSLSYAQAGRDPEERRDPVVLSASLEVQKELPDGRVFGLLEAAGQEAETAVGGEGARSANILLRNFDDEALSDALARRRFDVVHLATHASFEGRTDRSFIVTNGETIPLAELRRLVEQSRVRGGDLDLLVLSACETAVGDDQAGMGFAGAAVQAGAQSALASLWAVNDYSTAELMQTFYERYRAGDSKAEALRTAQLSLIEGGEFDDPYFWSAFTLIGGWR
jgi:CHAT domain-containing protein